VSPGAPRVRIANSYFASRACVGRAFAYRACTSSVSSLVSRVSCLVSRRPPLHSTHQANVPCDEYAYLQTHVPAPDGCATPCGGADRYTRAACIGRGNGTGIDRRDVRAARYGNAIETVGERIVRRAKGHARRDAGSGQRRSGIDGSAVHSDRLFATARRRWSIRAQRGADAASANAAADDDFTQSAHASSDPGRRPIVVAAPMAFVGEDRREHRVTRPSYRKSDGKSASLTSWRQCMRDCSGAVVTAMRRAH
jgi:hypothetical protein